MLRAGCQYQILYLNVFCLLCPIGLLLKQFLTWSFVIRFSAKSYMLSTSQGSVLCKNMVIQTWTVLYYKCAVLFEKVCTYHTFSSLCKDQFGLHVYIVSYCEVFSFSKERQSCFYICWNINNPILVQEQKALDFRVFCWDFIPAQHHGKLMWCWKCCISRWPVNVSIWFGSITCLFNIFRFFPSLTSWQTQVLGSKTWNLVAINTYLFGGAPQ